MPQSSTTANRLRHRHSLSSITPSRRLGFFTLCFVVSFASKGPLSHHVGALPPANGPLNPSSEPISPAVSTLATLPDRNGDHTTETASDSSCPAPRQDEAFRCCTDVVAVSATTAANAARDIAQYDALRYRYQNLVEGGCTPVDPLPNASGQWHGIIQLCGRAGAARALSLARGIDRLLLNCPRNSIAVGGTAWVSSTEPSYVLVAPYGVEYSDSSSYDDYDPDPDPTRAEWKWVDGKLQWTWHDKA